MGGKALSRVTAGVAAGTADLAGQRLDRALGALLPDLGLRGRRRSIERGAVLVNGRPRAAAYRLRPEDVISLAAADEEKRTTPWPAQGAGSFAYLVTRQGDYCFLYKPAGLHSAALAGGSGLSLEALAPRLLALELPDPMPDPMSDSLFDSLSGPRPGPILLQRLDHGTSGLVCVALDEAAAVAFRRAEAEGQCEKRYLALLDGLLNNSCTVRHGLDTDGRRVSRLLADTEDHSRWTEFQPLHVWRREAREVLENLGLAPAAAMASRGLTLAACRIRRGARHQIRAHAAAMGLPLWGDALYGRVAGEEEGGVSCAADRAAGGTPGRREGFFLHHGGLYLPCASCALQPFWPLPEPVLASARRWLERAPH